jgi:transposase
MTDAATEIEALRAALAKAEARADANAADAARAKAVLSGSEALIAHLRLEIEKLRRELYGQRSERKQRLLEQMELQLEEMEATASEDEALAEAAAAKAKVAVAGFTRARPVRKPFPEHLPRERVVLPAPCACAACGSSRLAKMGEDVTDTLEVVPRSWKVIQTVREKFTCRDCERISQPPAPFHPTPRGWAGPSLLAMIAFEKYGQHQPLNRQAERYAREGVELSVSVPPSPCARRLHRWLRPGESCPSGLEGLAWSNAVAQTTDGGPDLRDGSRSGRARRADGSGLRRSRVGSSGRAWSPVHR